MRGREQKLKAFSQLLLLVTFNDLQKVIESESGSSKAAESNRILQRLRGKQFWDWGIKEH